MSAWCMTGGSVHGSSQPVPAGPPSNGGPWSIILAGGEGERIKPFIMRWLRRHKPKQYCAFVGTRSMLQHTLARADLLSTRDHQLTVIKRSHLRDARHQLAGRSLKTVILQPQNCDTAAGVFLPLTYVRRRDPDATVVVYPSDHFIYPEDKFVEVMTRVIRAAETLSDKLVLLGVTPDRPEPEYGWIIPGESLALRDGRDLKGTRTFVEKPGRREAEAARASGGLWNTLIFAVKVKTLWGLGTHCFPEIMRLFERLASVIGTSRERAVLREIYEIMPARNFSSGLLARVVDHVAVAELGGVTWSDWGRPERIAETLQRMDKTPAFPWACLKAEI